MSARCWLVNGFSLAYHQGFEGYPNEWRPYLWGS